MSLRHFAAIPIVFLLLLTWHGPAVAQVEDLIGTLTSDLGVSEEQASGGSGAIFQLAEERMEPSAFGQISEAIPGLDGLMGAAPDVGEAGSSDLLGQATSALGGGSDLGQLAALAGPFSELGLSPEMIGQFVPVVLDFVQSNAGGQAMSAMQAALLG